MVKTFKIPKVKLHLLIIIGLVAVFLSNCGNEQEPQQNEEINSKLEVFEEPEEEIKPFRLANIMPYFKENKWGYANKQGEIVIPCKYTSVGFFSEGMAWVGQDGRYGYIDTTGKIAIEPTYLEAESFKYGVAIVKSSKYKGLINKKGELRLPFEYEDLLILNDSLFCFKQNNQWGVITSSGRQIVNPIYDNSFVFENGSAVVRRNRKFGVINQKGTEFIPCKYDQITPSRNGESFILGIEKRYNDKLYGLLNKNGKEILSISKKNISESVNNSFIVEENNNVVVLNNKKDTLISGNYISIRSGNTNFLAAQSKGLWGFIDLKGDTVISFRFNDAYGFINNNAIVKGGGYGVINTNGDTLVPLEFDRVEYAGKEVLRVFKDEKYGFYSSKGEKLTDCIYDEVDYNLNAHERFIMEQGGDEPEVKFGRFVNNYALIGIKGRMGAISKKGKEVISPYYHQLGNFNEEGIAIASFNKTQALVNNKGELLTDIKYKGIRLDEKSDYFYAISELEVDGKLTIKNIGFFGMDGTLYSDSKAGVKPVESEEDIILAIRKEYQNITNNLKNSPKGKWMEIEGGYSANFVANRMVAANAAEKISYEYYYNANLSTKGPFFILKIDKSGGEAQYDRYYYKEGVIVRWVNREGKKEIVANGPYAPEHEEHFMARLLFAAYNNQLILQNDSHKKELQQIRNKVVEIDQAISAGKYKKGDVYENFEGSGGSGHEEYVDDKGRPIYKHEHEGSDYHSYSQKEYYQQDKLIYSTSAQEQYSNLMAIGSFDHEESSKSSSETFYFADGTRLVFSTKFYSNGEILFVTEE